MTSHDPHAMLASDAALPRPGSIVGGYVITRQAGQGGMAVVFEARHQSLGKRVAIKMLLPHLASHGNIARRFTREGEASARLSHLHSVEGVCAISCNPGYALTPEGCRKSG